MNEGHSGFLAIERIRELVAQGKTYEEAKEAVKKGTIFTTHTPVPAGIDMFPVWLVERFFYNIWPELGIDRDEFINLAKQTWNGAISSVWRISSAFLTTLMVF